MKNVFKISQIHLKVRGWIDVLGSDSNEVLEHKFAAASSLLWQKRIFSMLIQLVFNFDKKTRFGQSPGAK